METLKVHVSQDGYSSFSCPSCEKGYRVSVARFKNKKHTLVTRCKCGERFEVDLNFRRFYRKKIDIVGEFINLSSDSGTWSLMTVINLSMSGLRFTAVGPTGIKKDDKLRIKFTLDDKRADSIDKDVVVREVGHDQ